MNIESGKNLTLLHTFQLSSQAEFYAEPHDLSTCLEALDFATSKSLPVFILGGGSNLIPPPQVLGLVVKPQLKGISIVHEDSNTASLRVGSSENWHEFVMHTVSLNLFGLENLALIPGTVGAAPIQNIGAYGVEAKDSIAEVEYLDFLTRKVEIIPHSACRFGYRDSRFKTQGSNSGLIVSVTFKLRKTADYKLNYGELKEKFASASPRNSKEVAEAVAEIRRNKLPDPLKVPNAGSFFKNPVLRKSQFDQLIQVFPNIPHFATENAENTKVAAGWLIDQCGWKGKSMGPVGTYPKQALCLVRNAPADLSDLKNLVEAIVRDVHSKFGIELEREPICWE